MSEIIYVLMIAFVGYVVYTVMNDKNGAGVETHFDTSASPLEKAEDLTLEAHAAKVNVVAESVEQSAEASQNGGDEIKNPKTGEVSKIPNNYRFGKRWIKEALVEEGLLDRIYKNNEVDDAVSAKAAVAMVALKNLDQYRV